MPFREGLLGQNNKIAEDLSRNPEINVENVATFKIFFCALE